MIILSQRYKRVFGEAKAIVFAVVDLSEMNVDTLSAIHECYPECDLRTSLRLFPRRLTPYDYKKKVYIYREFSLEYEGGQSMFKDELVFEYVDVFKRNYIRVI